jgi:hypothetical protein
MTPSAERDEPAGSVRYAFFILLRATPEWLRLSRPERSAHVEQHLVPLLRAYSAVRTRHFDAEAFSTVCSDVMLVETTDLTQYYSFIEGLRDSPLVTVPYFEFLHIIPAIEDGFRAYEARLEHSGQN